MTVKDFLRQILVIKLHLYQCITRFLRDILYCALQDFFWDAALRNRNMLWSTCYAQYVLSTVPLTFPNIARAESRKTPSCFSRRIEMKVPVPRQGTNRFFNIVHFILTLLRRNT